jgi:hypothetical protein
MASSPRGSVARCSWDDRETGGGGGLLHRSGVGDDEARVFEELCRLARAIARLAVDDVVGVVVELGELIGELAGRQVEIDGTFQVSGGVLVGGAYVDDDRIGRQLDGVGRGASREGEGGRTPTPGVLSGILESWLP